MRTGPPARQGPAFPRWLPIVVVGAVAVGAILLATRGGKDKDVVTAGATTTAINTGTSLASPTTIATTASLATSTSIATANVNSPEGVSRAVTDLLIAGRCIDALGFLDTASRRLIESIQLDLCALLADDPLTSYQIHGVTMLDPDRARIDNTARFRSGDVNTDPDYALREGGIWKDTLEYLEADPSIKATTGNSPQGVVKAFYDALSAGRCDEAKRHLDTRAQAVLQRQNADVCALQVGSYRISGLFVYDPDSVFVYATATSPTGAVFQSAPFFTVRDGGTWKISNFE